MKVSKYVVSKIGHRLPPKYIWVLLIMNIRKNQQTKIKISVFYYNSHKLYII